MVPIFGNIVGRIMEGRDIDCETAKRKKKKSKAKACVDAEVRVHDKPAAPQDKSDTKAISMMQEL